MERPDHAAEAIRIIDQTLLEESDKLEELRTVVEQNGTEIDEEHFVFGWFQRIYEHPNIEEDPSRK